jgi:hypothetical protein
MGVALVPAEASTDTIAVVNAAPRSGPATRLVS